MDKIPQGLIPNPEVRKYIYRALAVLAPVAIFYGLLSGQEAALWLAVAAALLGAGANELAALNTPKAEPKDEVEDTIEPELEVAAPVYETRKARIEAEGR